MIISSSDQDADNQNWRTFVRQFIVFCFNLTMKIPKGEKKICFFSIPIRTTRHDFPPNICLREGSYEKLKHLTFSEFEGVLPLELSSCIDAMLKSNNPREFEVWLESRYDDFHTARKLL